MSKQILRTFCAVMYIITFIPAAFAMILAIYLSIGFVGLVFDFVLIAGAASFLMSFPYTISLCISVYACLWMRVLLEHYYGWRVTDFLPR
jgi:hypothetical protein